MSRDIKLLLIGAAVTGVFAVLGWAATMLLNHDKELAVIKVQIEWLAPEAQGPGLEE